MFSTVGVSSAIILALTLVGSCNAKVAKEKTLDKNVDDISVVEPDVAGKFDSLNPNEEIAAVIGGDPVSPGTYPWFASAMIGDSQTCGGMLVAPEYVLTAAHCVGSFNAFDIGSLCNTNENCGQLSEMIPMIGQPIVHPEYDIVDNDFALVKLERRSTITPVSMDSDNLVSSYTSSTSLWTLGFGRQDPIMPYYPDQLIHVEVKYVPHSICVSEYADHFLDVTSNMMCAADPGQDSCNGDSGGPLLDRENNKLVGVVSWKVVHIQKCTDTPLGWYDADGEEYNCTWYAEGSNCEIWGDCCADENGVTANMACCACGGGESSSNTPTAVPTNFPTLPPSSSPTMSPTVVVTSSYGGIVHAIEILFGRKVSRGQKRLDEKPIAPSNS